jgi:hypothetical protein
MTAQVVRVQYKRPSDGQCESRQNKVGDVPREAWKSVTNPDASVRRVPPVEGTGRLWRNVSSPPLKHGNRDCDFIR